MVVDDSAVVRGLQTRILEADAALEVVASAPNGEAAVRVLDRMPIDVVILDVEMPVMDGLTALPLLLRRDPGIKVVMASTLTARNADISLKALEAGAADYVAKPSSTRDLTQPGADYARELVEKVKALGAHRRIEGGSPRPAPATPVAPRVMAGPTASPPALRAPSAERPEVIAVASSTGGPQALFRLFADLNKLGRLGLPVLITQHMPATFTAILAEHLARQTGLPAHEAKDGEQLSPGTLHVAPGDHHLVVTGRGALARIKLNQDPPENFCRPAADPMFRSLAAAFGGRVLAVVLTGMGSDGAKGAQSIVGAGGTVIAQDEASSVVWGMPGAAVQAGVCSAVLPLADLAGHMHRLIQGRSR